MLPAAQRAAWLPPWGRGNELSAESWAAIVEVPEAFVDVLLTALGGDAIAAWAAPVSPARTGRANSQWRIWVDALGYAQGEEVVRRTLLHLDKER